jgi:AcrR family transcriptional regulator
MGDCHLYPRCVVVQHEGDPRLRPGPRGLSREFVQAHQRERMINGMVAAVDAKGYMATSVADVLAKARVSRSAFYEQFRDKEDCFLACYDLGAGLLLEAATGALAPGGVWPQRVHRVYEALLRTFAEHAQLARVCMVEALAAGPAANLRYRQALAGFVSLIEHDVVANVDYPRVPRTLIFGLVGGSSAIIYEEIAAGRTAELPRLTDDLTRFALAAFMGCARASNDPTEELSTGT